MSEGGIKIGDVVQLKSGGPKVTVDSLIPGGKLKCVRSEGDEIRGGTLDSRALERKT